MEQILCNNTQCPKHHSSPLRPGCCWAEQIKITRRGCVTGPPHSDYASLQSELDAAKVESKRDSEMLLAAITRVHELADQLTTAKFDAGVWQSIANNEHEKAKAVTAQLTSANEKLATLAGAATWLVATIRNGEHKDIENAMSRVNVILAATTKKEGNDG